MPCPSLSMVAIPQTLEELKNQKKKKKKKWRSE
jgi:hypothetical protein